MATLQFRLAFKDKGHKSLEHWCLVIHLTTINEIKLPGKTVTSTDELVDIFNDHFSNIGPKIAESIPNDNDVSFRDFITQQKSKTKNSFSFRPVSVTLVYTLLVNLSTTKATGMDKISAKILQVAAPCSYCTFSY